MKSLLYSEGDLFEAIQKLDSKTLLPHVCNNQGAWGAGFVVPLGRRYPKSREDYLKWADSKGYDVAFSKDLPFAIGKTQFVQVNENVTVCNMVAQTLGGSRPLRYDALVQCMLQVANHAVLEKVERIDCPLFGSKLAGGDWNFIEQLIQDCWISRDIGVMVHYMPSMAPAGFMEWFSANYVGEIGGAVEVQP